MNKKIETIFNDIYFKELLSYYEQVDYLSILSCGRRELSHSSFIAWLADPSGNHGLNDFFLQSIFEIFIARFYSKSIDISGKNINIFTEKTIKSGRLDIYIESADEKWQIVIENKVHSKEGDHQLKKYFEELNNKYDDTFFLYLKPHLLSGSEYPLSADFKVIYYQEIIPLLNSSFELAVNKGHIETALLIKSYVRSLSIISLDSVNFDAMALSCFELKQLKRLYRNHKLLFEDIKSEISESESNDYLDSIESIKNSLMFINLLKLMSFGEVLNLDDQAKVILFSNDKDNSKYDVLNDAGIIANCVPKTNLFYILVENYINNNIGINLKKFEEDFPNSFGIEDIEIELYKVFKNSKEAQIENKKHYPKRKNPFFDYENIFELEDCVIVLKKAWTAKQKNKLNGKSSIELLLQFIKKNESKFNIRVEQCK